VELFELLDLVQLPPADCGVVRFGMNIDPALLLTGQPAAALLWYATTAAALLVVRRGADPDCVSV